MDGGQRSTPRQSWRDVLNDVRDELVGPEHAGLDLSHESGIRIRCQSARLCIRPRMPSCRRLVALSFAGQMEVIARSAGKSAEQMERKRVVTEEWAPDPSDGQLGIPFGRGGRMCWL